MSYDVIIVGAGHNGLAAGTILARAGRKVLILEAQAEPGGAIRTAEVTLPGFRHDLYATNLNAFAGSAFYGAFGADLARHGFELVAAHKAFCSIFPDGTAVGVTTSLDETLGGLRRLSPRDAESWRNLTERYARIGPRLLEVLRQPMPSRGIFDVPLDGLRIATQSAGAFVTRHFEHPHVQALWAVWGMHLDFGPEVRGGALYPFLQCMQTQAAGIRLGRGGAGAMVAAMAALFRESGGELRCGAPVTEIVTERGAAVGVAVDGERVEARAAVIASLTPTVLSRLVKRPLTAKRYRYGPGAMMVHLALSDLPDWRDPAAREFVYVHIAPTLASMSRTYRDALAGTLPEEPVLVVAQPTLVDPSRAPEGRHVLSVQVRMVPAALDKDAYADRVIDLIERYAPGLRRKILARHVIGPADLESANPNLVGGDSLAGSHHLDQHFVFRPFLGWSRYCTPIRRLFLCGAATWPGAGVGAGSGWLLGHMLTQR